MSISLPFEPNSKSSNISILGPLLPKLLPETEIVLPLTKFPETEEIKGLMPVEKEPESKTVLSQRSVKDTS